MSQKERVPLPGSDHSRPADTRVGPADPDEAAEVTVYLRRPVPLPEGARLSREELAERFGASGEDLSVLEAFAAEHALSVGEVDLVRRAVLLRGRLGDLAAAFGASLDRYSAGDGVPYRALSGPLNAPSDLAAVVTGVFGLDQRPQARPHLRRAGAGTPPVAYTPPQVAEAYSFPPGTDGAGQCVALLELGGGYRESDLADYFAGLGLAPPAVRAVGVDGAANSPGAPQGPDAEVMLDIEVVASVAPGVQVVVYFAPNTDRGFLDAVTAAVHDRTARPSVVSISWGGPEDTWTLQAMNQMEDAFATAAALGVTVTVAAGDRGSSDGVADGRPHVDFPASAPHALGCGGTTLQISGGKIVSEVVWDDLATGGGATGGGVSSVFALPSWQDGAGVPPAPGPTGGRGVPDVAGDADPRTGYEVRVDASSEVVGGTSAVAPLWAGLIARVNEGLGRDVGYLDPQLYRLGLPGGSAPGVVHDITSGDNGAYRAGPGWDPCTGLGSPDGSALLSALAARGACGAAGRSHTLGRLDAEQPEA